MNIYTGEASATDAVLRALARKAVGMSGADIERIVREARQKARRERRGLHWSDVDGLLSASLPTRPESLRWRMALHEAGHVVARVALGLGTIRSVSIDGPTGGMVMSEAPAEVAETEAFLSSQLVAMLAGRAAEEVLLGSCVAGSGGGPDSDLARATDLALQMEVSFGFGAHTPLLHRNAATLGPMLIARPEIASHVSERLDSAYAAARQLIRSHEPSVRKVAKAVIEHAVLEGLELETMLDSLREDLGRSSAGIDEEPRRRKRE